MPKLGRLAPLLLTALLAAGCVHQSAQTTTWGETPYAPPPAWERTGHVTQVRQTVHTAQGDPVAGAATGAVVGGLLGSIISGGHGWGAFVGAMDGAAIGASASQGSAQQVVYEVTIQFDDGGVQAYAFRGYLPFQPGQAVRLTPQGLSRM